jgi:hypothetical protein
MDMKPLTPKQSHFASLVAGGLNLSESYRRSYDAQGMSSGAIRVEGHRLSRHPKIVIAVKALRQGCPKTKRQVAEASEEWVKIRLEDLADSPYSTTSQKISALEYLGKNLGMF